MNTAERFRQLFGLHTTGVTSPSERAEFLDMLAKAEHDEDLRQLMVEAWSKEASHHLSDWEADQMLHRIIHGRPVTVPLYRRTIFRVSAAAAVLLLVVSTYLLWPNKEQPGAVNASHNYKGDVAPGRNGAILTLASGKKVMLDTIANGSLTLEGGIRIEKKNGEIIYTGKGTETAYNIVSTDRGRQWSLVLPDGSKVWLNAASSIKYPLNSKNQERLVELTGEAFFDVVHDDKHPFRVKVGNRIMEDIGTQFNINAYSDESTIKTTVIEGSVKVSTTNKNEILRANQQASIETGSENIKVVTVNTEDAVAWKNGFFSFSHDNLSTVMRQLSRWYNVEIDYNNGASAGSSFTGNIDRSLSLVQVLKELERSHAHFKIEEDKKIVILP